MFVKFSKCSVIGASDPVAGRVASRRKLGSFEYDDRGTGFLYVSVRACTADVPNLNRDMLPHEELKTAYRTFVGKPVYVNHANTNLDRARGFIIDAAYHDEDPADRWIEILMEMDEVTFPTLCGLIRSGDIDTVSMGLNCFVPGTHITMSNGTVKNIEDVAVGDEVITHLGNVRRVADTMASLHSGIVYEVRSYGNKRPMVLTDEHPVWVRRMKNDAMRTIRESRIAHNGDNAEHSCICGRSFKSHRSLAAHVREAAKNGVDGHGYQPDFEGWVIASDLEVGDYVLDPKPVRTSRGGNRAFARLLGYYLAEGNFGYDKKRNIGVGAPAFVEWTFCDSETDYHDEVMALCSELGYKAVGPYIKRGAATIRCNSPELANMMLEHGGKYSHGKRISDEAMRWDDECLGDLVEAYLNGDGHYIDDRRVAYSTVSKDLAYQIFSICTQLGIKMSKPIARSSERISDIAKHTRYVSYGDRSEEQKKMMMCYVDEQGTWRRIDRIRVLPYTGMVYNFEVEEDHSYIAEGYAVHNCETTTCSVCGNVAEQPSEFCEHIRQKGRTFGGVLAYEICNKIAFFEESWVYDPADPTATVQALECEARTASFDDKEAAMTELDFFESTVAVWKPVGKPAGEPDYTSASGSEYWYEDEGATRRSNHWGWDVGSCHWYLEGLNDTSSKLSLFETETVAEPVCGFCRWDDFIESYDGSGFDVLYDKAASAAGKTAASGEWVDGSYGDDSYQLEVYDDEDTAFSGTVMPEGGGWAAWMTSPDNLMTYGEEDFATKEEAMRYVEEQARSEGFEVTGKTAQWVDLVKGRDINGDIEARLLSDFDYRWLGDAPTFDDDEQWAFPYGGVDISATAEYGEWGGGVAFKATVEEGKCFPDGLSVWLYPVNAKADRTEIDASHLLPFAKDLTGGYAFWNPTASRDIRFDTFWGYIVEGDEGVDGAGILIADAIAERINYENTMNEIGHVADNMVNKLRIPEEVDMQNSDRVCPICGSPDFDGTYCDVCEYVEYAEGFGDIDTEQARENKEDRKAIEDEDDGESADEEMTDDIEDAYEENEREGRTALRSFDISAERDTVLDELDGLGYADGIDYDIAGEGSTVVSHSASLNNWMDANGIGENR